MNILLLEKALPLILILGSGGLVAAADGFIKQASINQNSLWNSLRNPLMIPVGIIYIFAVVVFSFAFIKRWDLGIVGILQIIVYSIVVVGTGVLFFHERLTYTHGIGVLLAVIAAILMNI